MRGNKLFHGFCGFIFLLLDLFSVTGAALPFDFAPPFNDNRQSLSGSQHGDIKVGSDQGIKFMSLRYIMINGKTFTFKEFVYLLLFVKFIF